jgi:predicted nucleotidyltransferase
MISAEQLLVIADKHLRELKLKWSLIGGMAVSARSEPRFTRDLDVAVAVDSDTEAEDIIAQMRGRGLSVLAVLEQSAADRMATVRLSPTGDESAIIDLLFASSGIENEIIQEAENFEITPGLKVPLARVGHLIALKVLSRSEARLQDSVDLQHLLAVADDTERNRAMEAVKLITERGYNRDKDLVSDLEHLCTLYTFSA